jgi:hypothetical protein
MHAPTRNEGGHMVNRTTRGFFSTETGRLAEITEPQKYVNSDAVRQWLVLMALSGKNNSPMTEDLSMGEALAFNNVCAGVQSGQIELDYAPANGQTLDIPRMDHPLYMQALLYWSTQLRCTVQVLAETHATLGSLPSLEQACTAVRQIEREAVITRSWRNSSKRRRSGGETIPMFQKTENQAKH